MKVGGRVAPPKAKYSPDPQYSVEAWMAHLEGTCDLQVVVGADGKTHDIKIARPLGMGLDEKALEAVSHWEFEPARLYSKPVSVSLKIQITFRLYDTPPPSAKTRDLWNKARLGNPEAELELGRALLEKRLFPNVEVDGHDLVEEAARKGLPEAQMLIGDYYRHGRGTDYIRAYAWYLIAEKSGVQHADKMLREITPKMSSDQISRAQDLAQNLPTAVNQ